MLKIHHIQQKIMSNLAECGDQGAAFEELRPLDVKSNLYAYHLKVLRQTGVIAKNNLNNYYLTEKGSDILKGIMPDDIIHKISVSVLLESPDQKPKIISKPLTAEDDRIAVIATELTQKYLTQNNLSQPIHIGDAYIKFYSQDDQLTSSTLHHIFSVKSKQDISHIKNQLPTEVVSEIIFAQQSADGHFFFERSYDEEILQK